MDVWRGHLKRTETFVEGSSHPFCDAAGGKPEEQIFVSLSSLSLICCQSSLSSNPNWKPEARKSILGNLPAPSRLGEGRRGLGSKGRCLPHPSVSGGVGTGGHISRYASHYLSTCYAFLWRGESKFMAPGLKPPGSLLLFDPYVLKISGEKAKLEVDISFIHLSLYILNTDY